MRATLSVLAVYIVVVAVLPVRPAQHVTLKGCTAPYVPGVNCNGKGLVTPPPRVASAAACCSICATEPRCSAWTWNTGNQLCYPKLNCSSPTWGPVVHPGQISGGAVPPRPPPTPSPPSPPPPPPPPPPPTWAGSHPGVLRVTQFGADPTGRTDSTAAIRAAVEAAYTAQLVLLFPLGRYVVNDTIEVDQDNYGSSLPINLRPARWRTNVLLGSTLGSRPVIVLAPNSSGYGASSAPKNVVKLHNTGRENDHMNQIFRGIDIEIGPGNPGAIGLFVHGAQGTAVQDVTVRMTDALAGFGGGGGAGASHVNIAAIGGQFGVWFGESEPGPVVVGGFFANQTVSGVAILRSQTTLVLVGSEIHQPQEGSTGAAIADTAYVIDSVVVCGGDSGSGRAVTNGTYLKGVYMRNCAPVAAGAPSPTSSADFTLAHEVAAGPMWADGESIAAGVIANFSSAAVETPPNVVAAHVRWTEATFPSFEDRAAVADAVLDCNAIGDGFSDDTDALQQCLETHDAVFLPKGLYRISRTLTLRPNCSLVGLSQTHSVIAPTTSGFTGTAVEPAPLVRTAANSSATLAFLGLVTWWHIPYVFTLDWRARGGLWRSNYETRVCECMWLSDYGSPNAAHGKFGTWPPSNCTPGVNLTVPKTLIRGTGSFYNWVSDEDVVFTDHTHYRHLYISNNSADPSDRLSFYAVNLEHSMAEANGELDGASHVDIFGLKKEGSTPILWIRDSTDINVFGTAGGYSALENASQAPSDFAPYRPSVYRVERTSPLKLSIDPMAPNSARQPSHTHTDYATDAVKCSYPLDDTQLQSGNFPLVDWSALKQSLWAPWCGFWYHNTLVLVDADGPSRTLVATDSPGVLYLRGYPRPSLSDSPLN